MAGLSTSAPPAAALGALAAGNRPGLKREPLGFLQQLASRWQAFAPRERALIGAAVAVVLLALLWSLAMAPALAVLKNAPAQRSALDARLQQMQDLQAQAKALQALPKVKSNEAARALEVLAKQRFGATTQVSVAGNQATLTLSNARPDALAQFLAQARSQANALPSQARLRRGQIPNGPINPNGPNNPDSWDGTLVLALPVQ